MPRRRRRKTAVAVTREKTSSKVCQPLLRRDQKEVTLVKRNTNHNSSFDIYVCPISCISQDVHSLEWVSLKITVPKNVLLFCDYLFCVVNIFIYKVYFFIITNMLKGHIFNYCAVSICSKNGLLLEIIFFRFIYYYSESYYDWYT